MSQQPPQRVVGDLSCNGCGYNLRTLEHTACCPECGLAVAASLSSGRSLSLPFRLCRAIYVTSVMVCCAAAVIVRYQVWPASMFCRLRPRFGVNEFLGRLMVIMVVLLMLGWWWRATSHQARHSIIVAVAQAVALMHVLWYVLFCPSLGG